MGKVLDPELKEKWVAALRSKKFNQGFGCLKSKQDGVYYHCPLGVLAEELDGRWVKSLGSDRFAFIPESGGDDWSFALATIPFYVLPSYIQHSIAIMNDVQQKSFGQIADEIEEHL